MILEWVQKMLSRRLNRKKQDVVRLRWQQTQLQQELDKIKKDEGSKI